MQGQYDTSYIKEAVAGSLESLGRLGALTVVMLGAPWCKPCKALKQGNLAILNKQLVARASSGVGFRVVDVEMDSDNPLTNVQNRVLVRQIQEKVGGSAEKVDIPMMVVLREQR